MAVRVERQFDHLDLHLDLSKNPDMSHDETTLNSTPRDLLRRQIDSRKDLAYGGFQRMDGRYNGAELPKKKSGSLDKSQREQMRELHSKQDITVSCAAPKRHRRYSQLATSKPFHAGSSKLRLLVEIVLLRGSKRPLNHRKANAMPASTLTGY
jgi:hypothetical protein